MESALSRAFPESLSIVMLPIEARAASSVTTMFIPLAPGRPVRRAAGDFGAAGAPAPLAKSLANAISRSTFMASALMASSPAGAVMSVIWPLAVIDVSSAASSTDRTTTRCPSMEASMSPRSVREPLTISTSLRTISSIETISTAEPPLLGRVGLVRGCSAAKGRQRQLDARFREPQRAVLDTPREEGPESSRDVKRFDLDSWRVANRHIVEIDRYAREDRRANPADRDRLADRIRDLRRDGGTNRLSGQDRSRPDQRGDRDEDDDGGCGRQDFLTIRSLRRRPCNFAQFLEHGQRVDR